MLSTSRRQMPIQNWSGRATLPRKVIAKTIRQPVRSWALHERNDKSLLDLRVIELRGSKPYGRQAVFKDRELLRFERTAWESEFSEGPQRLLASS